MTSGSWLVPGYMELGELGSGSQGRVALARNESTGLTVAIKYLAGAFVSDEHNSARFRDEARVMTRVNDPHVARLHDYVETAEGAAIVMEAVDGVSLDHVLAEQGALTPEAALVLLKGSLLGLAAAHSVGIVHRDYKPANVIVQRDGSSKLIDFGIAVPAGPGDRSGTPAYMAPELWLGEAAAPATDVYAATCVFFQCLTGRLPFRGDTVRELMAQHLHAPIPVDELPQRLHGLVTRGLAKDAWARPADAVQFITELETAAIDAYGPDWERRGLGALGATALVLAAAFPSAIFGTAVIASGGLGGALGIGSATTGTGAAVTGAGHTGATTVHASGEAIGAVSGKGLLAKIGGAKGATGLGGAVTAATAVTAAVLLWPSAPAAGGESHGSIRAFFTRPGVLLDQPHMPSAETPFMNLDVTVRPARVRHGMKLTVTTKFSAKTVEGAKYLPGGTRQCFGAKSRRPDVNSGYNFGVGILPRSEAPDDTPSVWIYNFNAGASDVLPSRPSNRKLHATRVVTAVSQPYVNAQCAYLSSWIDTRELRIPGIAELRPGRYLVSPYSPPRINRTRSNGVEIPPESAGATVTGRLPVITVLDG